MPESSNSKNAYNSADIQTEYSFDEIDDQTFSKLTVLEEPHGTTIAFSPKHWKKVKAGTDGSLGDSLSKVALMPLTPGAKEVVDVHMKELKVGLFGTPLGNDEVPQVWRTGKEVPGKGSPMTVGQHPQTSALGGKSLKNGFDRISSPRLSGFRKMPLLTEVFKIKEGDVIPFKPKTASNPGMKPSKGRGLSQSAVDEVKKLAEMTAGMLKGTKTNMYKDDDQSLLMDIYALAKHAAALQKQLSNAIVAGKEMDEFDDYQIGT